MALVNEHFLKLPNNYLFSDIAKKVNAFKVSHPKTDLIRLGIGDVTRPLPQASIEAMHKAVDELANKETFHGYGPEQGYDFLIDAVIRNDYAPRGVHLEPGEVFISDGAKSDTGNIGDILRHDNSIGVTDPIYPVYIDSNVMCGRAGILEDGRWSNVVYLPCLSENNFVPEIPDRRIDILYLCYPNNPTGTVISKAELKKWVNYALENDKRSEESSDRISQFLEDGRIHRGALRIHRRTERTHSRHAGRRAHSAEPDVEPPPVHQVQRHILYHPAWCRSDLYPRGQKASESHHTVLYG